MFLIVDFMDLDLEFTTTDIRFDEHNADYTVKRLTQELCKGIDAFSGETVPQKETVILLGPDRRPVDPESLVSQLCRQHWNDWDTIYLTRRR